MRDRIRELAALGVIAILLVAVTLTLRAHDRLQRRNEELSGAIKQYIRAAALYAQENQRLAGQLSWCLNTPLAGFHPTVEQVSQ